MGKLISFVIMLIFIDLLFLATGQLTLDSPTSAIINSIQDPTILLDTNWWTILITGLSGLALTTAVVAGFVTRSSDIAIFFVMAGTLALLAGDFLFIYNHLASINTPLAILIMSPIIVIFTLVIVEWARGKD